MNLDWQKIKTATWYRQRTDSLPCYTVGAVYGVLRLLKSSGRCLFRFNDGFLENYFTEEYLYSEAKKIIKKYQDQPAILEKKYAFWLSETGRLENKINKATKSDLNELTDTDLINFYSQIGYESSRIWQLPIFMDVFDTNSPEFLEIEFKNYILKPTVEEINILISSDKLLKLQEYKLALGKFLKKQTTAEKLISDFCFLHYAYSGGEDLDKKTINKDLNNLKKNEHWKLEHRALENYQEYLKKQKQTIIKKYQLKKKAVRLTQLISLTTRWRDERKVFTQKTSRVTKILGQEIARRSHISWDKLGLCPPFEIKSLPIKNNILKKYEVLNKTNYFMYFFKGRLRRVTGSQYDKLLNYVTALDPSQRLKGRVAYPGVVKGIIKIVHGPVDFKNFKKGNILVTSMTRPEFMPIMNKVRAIITDEGGITCHAAIISRELRFPCIVGTKFATKVLHDGDLVEVDANQGTFMIIK
jgi:phosphohistidine swiveling domain-containing protein